MAKTTPKSRIGKKKTEAKSSKAIRPKVDNFTLLGMGANSLEGIIQLHAKVDGIFPLLHRLIHNNEARDLLLELYETVRQTGIDAYGEDLEPAPGTVMARVKEYLFGKGAVETVRGSSGSGDQDQGSEPDSDSIGNEIGQIELEGDDGSDQVTP